jgi:glycosyltransferase involved in cell wall biosynthesis
MQTLAILITYYNEKELLTECLESLRVQTVMPDEIMVYDDCSTFPAVDYLPNNFPLQIKVIRGTENKKPAFGRNLLMEETSCTYVHFQDADDLFKPNCVEKIKEKIMDTGADFLINDIEAQKDNQIVALRVINVSNITNKNIVSYGISGSYLVPSVTYTKELAKIVGGFRLADVLAQSEDYEFHIRLAHTAKKPAIIDESLVIQRLRNNSHSSSNQNQVYISGLKALQLLRESLPKIYHKNIADRASKIGTILYLMDDIVQAREAWIFAQKDGYQLFNDRNKIFQLLVKIIGIEKSEYLSRKFQKMKKYKL